MPLNSNSKSRQEVKRVGWWRAAEEKEGGSLSLAAEMREEMSRWQRMNTLFSVADSYNRAIITNLPCRPIHITMCLLKRLISATGVKVLHTGDSQKASASAFQSFPSSSRQHKCAARLGSAKLSASFYRLLVLMKLAKFANCPSFLFSFFFLRGHKSSFVSFWFLGLSFTTMTHDLSLKDLNDTFWVMRILLDFVLPMLRRGRIHFMYIAPFKIIKMNKVWV